MRKYLLQHHLLFFLFFPRESEILYIMQHPYGCELLHVAKGKKVKSYVLEFKLGIHFTITSSQ